MLEKKEENPIEYFKEKNPNMILTFDKGNQLYKSCKNYLNNFLQTRFNNF